MFDAFFNVIFGPLLSLPPAVSIFVVSVIVALFLVLIYKWMTDQNEMKNLKDRLSEYQKKLRDLKSDPAKMLDVQKEAMQVNMQYMGKSLKPTIVTFIPMILILGWLSAHFAFEPLLPNEQFDVVVKSVDGAVGNVSIIVPAEFEVIGESSKEWVSGIASFSLKGPLGEYLLTFKSGDEEIDKQVIITEKREYAAVSENYGGKVFSSVEVVHAPLRILFGLSWIWSYVIFSVVSTVVLRKVLKVY